MTDHALPHPHGHGSQAHRSRAGHLRAIGGGALLLAALWVLPTPGVATGSPGDLRLEHARILSIDLVDPASGALGATVEVLDGPRAGERLLAELGMTAGAAAGGDSIDGGTPSGGAGGPGGSATDLPAYVVGDEVVLQVSTSPDGELVAVADRWRIPLLGGVGLGFALLVVLVAGWRGIRALLALGLTVGAVVKVLLPLLILGWDPVALAVSTGSVVTVLTLLLTEGPRRSTAAAVIGTFAALLATALIAGAVTELARFSVFGGSEEVAFLRGLTGLDVDLGSLVLASIILGALGVLDDVTVTQAIAVEELARSDPGASRPALAARAMNVGRAHIAATVNTLVLAYVAASLPLLLLFALSPQPLGTIASSELVAVEVLRAIVGSIGIVLAVPFTTFVAARLAPRVMADTGPLVEASR